MNIYEKELLLRFELFCEERFGDGFNPLKSILLIIREYFVNAEIKTIFRHYNYEVYPKDKRNISINIGNLFITLNGIDFKIDAKKQKEFMRQFYNEIVEEFKKNGIELCPREYIEDVSVIGLSVTASSASIIEVELPEYLIPFVEEFQ